MSWDSARMNRMRGSTGRGPPFLKKLASTRKVQWVKDHLTQPVSDPGALKIATAKGSGDWCTKLYVLPTLR